VHAGAGRTAVSSWTPSTASSKPPSSTRPVGRSRDSVTWKLGGGRSPPPGQLGLQRAGEHDEEAELEIVPDDTRRQPGSAGVGPAAWRLAAAAPDTASRLRVWSRAAAGVNLLRPGVSPTARPNVVQAQEPEGCQRAPRREWHPYLRRAGSHRRGRRHRFRGSEGKRRPERRRPHPDAAFPAAVRVRDSPDREPPPPADRSPAPGSAGRRACTGLARRRWRRPQAPG
jgi:hypothetical protein